MLQNKAIKDYRKLFCLLKDGTVFTIIDTETTGLSSIENRIVEVAAIKFSKDGILDKFSTLVNPEQKNSLSVHTNSPHNRPNGSVCTKNKTNSP